MVNNIKNREIMIFIHGIGKASSFRWRDKDFALQSNLNRTRINPYRMQNTHHSF
jgi:hypothetical protein